MKTITMTSLAFLVIIASLALLVTGCATLAQTGSIEKAYEQYEAQEYEATLELIIRAEHVKETNPETKAELTYLKAQTYEKMGQKEKAITLYEYLKEQHADSQYGYLANKKLGNL